MTAGRDEERRASEESSVLLAVQEAVTRALAASPTVADGVVRVLPVICEHLGWQSAELWTVDRTAGRLQPAGGYPLPHAAGTLEALAARAWRSAAPAVAADLAADPAGDLRAALAVPVLLDTSVLGVIAVCSRDVRPPDDRTRESLTGIACQVAQWLGRLRAEDALKAREHDASGDAALRDRETWARTLLASIGTGYCLCEMIVDEAGRPVDYRFLEVNPLFEVMTGLSDAVGRTAYDLLPSLESHWVDAYARVGLDRETLRFESGSALMGRWFEVFATPAEPHGRFVLVFSDITERRRVDIALRNSEERFRHLADAMPQLVWIAAHDGAVTYYNSRADRYGGLKAGAGNIWDWTPVVHPDDREHTAAVWQEAVARGDGYQCEHRIRMADGSYRWHLSRASRAGDGEDAQWFGTATDVHELKEADRALRDSEERLRTAAQAAGFGAYDLDPIFGQMVCSDTLREALGVPQDTEVHVHTLAALVHRDDRQHFTRTMQELLDPAGPGEHEREFRIVRADGGVRWMRDTGRTTFEGEPGSRRAIRVVGTIQDVTDRKRSELALQESEERFRIMADETPVIIWVTDASGGVQFANREYREYFGASGLDLGHGWQPLVHPEDHAYVEAFLDAVRLRRAFNAEARVRAADGTWRWIESHATPRFSADREFIGLVGSTRDITDQKRAIALEQESARQKDEFIAVLAHELRNPLAPIRTAAGVLLTDGSRDTAVRCGEVIDRQATHMARLLDDLLDVSRLSKGKLALRLQPVDLQDVIEPAVEAARPLIDEQGHQLVVSLPDTRMTLYADPARLTQVIGNLLNNAAKYSPPGADILLAATREDGRVEVRVRDTGIGIPAEMRDGVFELFTQGRAPGTDGSTGTSGGLGIGLALARRLVEMHGGTITVHSDGRDRGSEFVVTLPTGGSAPVQAPAPDHAPERDAPAALRCRVLIADDNVDSADMLALLLGQSGCDVRTVYDGEATLREVERFRPDVVLLDLGMPGVSGLEVCRRIRRERWGAGMVLIALTGWGQDDDRRRTAAAGFDRHFVKPVEPELLIQFIREVT
jgi:PAS domain S-box-containing protein